MTPGTRIRVVQALRHRPQVATHIGRCGIVASGFRRLIEGFVEVRLDLGDGTPGPYYAATPFHISELEAVESSAREPP